MKKLVSILTFVILLAIPLVLSTSIYVRPAKITVYSDDHPGENTATYYLTLKNNNAFTVNVTLTKTGSIKNYVTFPENEFQMQPSETKVVGMEIDISSSSFSQGEILIDYTPSQNENIPVSYSAQLTIHGRGSGTSQRCDGTNLNCGVYPECVNTYELDGCYDGYFKDYSCQSNEVRYTSRCTSPCCSQMYPDGQCVQGVCVGTSQEDVSITVNFNLTTETATITLLNSDTSAEINSSSMTGEGSLTSDREMVDLKIEYDNDKLILLAHNLNLTKLEGEQKIVLNDVSPSIPEKDVYRSYRIELPTQFDYDDVILKIKYSDISYRNQSSLTFYKCADFTDNTCSGSWIHVPTTLEGDYAKAMVTSFSVYSLVEPEQPTTTTTTTPPSSDEGNNPGGDGSGGGTSHNYPSGESTPTETTGFYDFPSSVEMDVNSSKEISGRFLNKYRGGLKGVTFKITGISNDWYEVKPSRISELVYEEEVDIQVTFNIPEHLSSGEYPITLQATSDSISKTFEKDITLKVKEIPQTTTTVVETTTTTTVQPVINDEKTGPIFPTGEIVSTVKSYWYVLPIIVGIGAMAKFYPLIGVSRGDSSGILNEETEDDSEEYISISVKEKKPEKKRVVKPVDKKAEETKNKLIEEIRKKAFAEDKKYRGF